MDLIKTGSVFSLSSYTLVLLNIYLYEGEADEMIRRVLVTARIYVQIFFPVAGKYTS